MNQSGHPGFARGLWTYTLEDNGSSVCRMLQVQLQWQSGRGSCDFIMLPCVVCCAALCCMGEAPRLCATQHLTPTSLAECSCVMTSRPHAKLSFTPITESVMHLLIVDMGDRAHICQPHQYLKLQRSQPQATWRTT